MKSAAKAQIHECTVVGDVHLLQNVSTYSSPSTVACSLPTPHFDLYKKQLLSVWCDGKTWSYWQSLLISTAPLQKLSAESTMATSSPRQLAYAPTPYSYLPNPALTAKVNLDEVRSAPQPHICLRCLISPVPGSEIVYHSRRTGPLRLSCRDIQHHSYPGWTGKGIHSGLNPGERVH